METRWDIVISSYHKDYTVVMLHDHFDKHAKSKYIGYEDDYDTCMTSTTVIPLNLFRV